MTNIYNLRANERAVAIKDLDGKTSDTLIVINIDTLEIVGKITPPLMEVEYKVGYNG